MYNIHLLPGSFGDCILIEYGKADALNYILIDGGPYFNFELMAEALKTKAPNLKKLELLIVTHIDIDHIDGMLRLLNQAILPFSIEQIWFNGFEQIMPLLPLGMLGYLQGDYLSMRIKELEIPHNACYFKGQAIVITDYKALPHFFLPGGMEILLLSPDRASLSRQAIDWEHTSEFINNIEKLREKFEDDNRYSELGVLGDEIDIKTLQNAAEIPDTSLANESSIAFIGSYEHKSCLFSGDAPSDALLRAIRPLIDQQGQERLILNAWKVAHHGSKKSTINSLMERVDAQKLLISSNGTKYGHPNLETIAKLFKNANRPLEFYFNYKTEFNKMWDGDDYKKQYKYEAFYPGDAFGITVEL